MLVRYEKSSNRDTVGQIRFKCRFGPIFLLSLVSLLISYTVGCDRSAELVNQKQSGVATRTKVAQDLLEETVSAYSLLQSYEDDAYVSLRYKLTDQPHEDRAPLSIAWQSSGLLGMRVYSVVAGPSDGRWRMRLGAEEESVAGQVLSRAIPKNLTMDWLVNDPLASKNMAAGLAGFPPQLDLLISDQPLSGLLTQGASLDYEPQISIDDRACHVVTVSFGEAQYRMFIDQATMLLRRLELPKANVPSEMLNDSRVSNVRLTIEFSDVRTNQTVDWNRFRVDVSEEDQLVNSFVPSVPQLETNGLGKQVPGFTLQDAKGQVVYDTSLNNRTRKGTVLLWLADHPACRLAAEQLNASRIRVAEIPGLKDAIDFVPIWAEPSPPRGDTFDSLAENWNLDGEIALDRAAVGRDLFGVLEAPSLVVLNSSNHVQFRESRANPQLSQYLPNLLARLAQGEDLAKTLVIEDREIRNRRKSELRIARSIEQAAKSDSDVRALGLYRPAVAHLNQLQRLEHSRKVFCSAVDASGNIWTLDVDGTLSTRPAAQESLTASTSLKTEWTARSGDVMSVSPGADYAALFSTFLSSASDSPSLEPGRVEILEMSTGRTQSMLLGTNADPIDVRWLQVRGAKQPRLAVITSNRKTVLLDPHNREQLSGDCPAQPLAILPGSGESTQVDGLVVLSDRSIQPLYLSQSSANESRAQPVTFRNPAHLTNMPSTLGFWPARGPWETCTNLTRPGADEQLTLARGWIAKDEPAFSHRPITAGSLAFARRIST